MTYEQEQQLSGLVWRIRFHQKSVKSYEKTEQEARKTINYIVEDLNKLYKEYAMAKCPFKEGTKAVIKDTKAVVLVLGAALESTDTLELKVYVTTDVFGVDEYRVDELRPLNWFEKLREFFND